MTITTVFDPPLPTDSLDVFNTKSFDTVSKLNQWGDEANDTAADVNADAAAAAASQIETALSQAAAANSASVALSASAALPWNVTTNYALGDPAFSTLSGMTYRRKSAGSGGSDPSLAPATWAPVGIGGLQLVTETGSTATIAANTDVLMTNSGQWAATAPPTPAEGERIELHWDNARIDNTLDLGTNTAKGRYGNVTGVMTLNAPTNELKLRWRAGYWRVY